MRKSFTMGLICVLTLSGLSAVSAANPKAGAICAKSGLKQVFQGKTFTCIKSGKKLVWNKGVVIVAAPKPSATAVATPSPTPSASLSPSPVPTVEPVPTPSPTPSPTKIEELLPNSFANLIERRNGIAEKVWTEVKTLSDSGRISTTFELKFGPNTSLPKGVSNPLVYMELASRLWSNFKQPASTVVFLYNYSDLSWVQQETLKLGGSWVKPQDLASGCTSPERCNAYGSSYQGRGQLFLGIYSRERYNVNTFHSNFAHEFSHAVQYEQVKSPSTVNGYMVLPCWFGEGQPMVGGESLAYGVLDRYRAARQDWLKTPAGVLGDYSPESIASFFKKAGLSRGNKCDATVRDRVYDVGYFAVEALAAVGGIESTMKLVEAMSNGESFEKNFERIYGVSWDEASTILAKVVSLQYLERL